MKQIMWVLFVLWLSIVSVFQYYTIRAVQFEATVLQEHEKDLTELKIDMLRKRKTIIPIIPNAEVKKDSPNIQDF
jgi:hypothetical protein